MSGGVVPVSEMSCQARILDKEFVIPGTSEVCHTTKECEDASFKKVSVDNGESQMRICKGCAKRFMTKSSKKDVWYGWFDCDYPEGARVKFSPWYNKIVKGVGEAEAEAEAEAEEVVEITEKMQSLKVADPVPMSKKEMLEQEIASVQVWMRGEGKAKENIKNQPAQLKKLLDLRAKLKALTD